MSQSSSIPSWLLIGPGLLILDVSAAQGRNEGTQHSNLHDLGQSVKLQVSMHCSCCSMPAADLAAASSWVRNRDTPCCSGAGQCGTCIVETLEDPNSLLDPAEREGAEIKKLKASFPSRDGLWLSTWIVTISFCAVQGKPDSFRLSCQLNVGDGTTSGRVKLRTRPQKK